MRPIVFLATGSKLCREHPAWFGLPAEATPGVVAERTRPNKTTPAKRSRPSSDRRKSATKKDEEQDADPSAGGVATNVKVDAGAPDNGGDAADDDIVDAVIASDEASGDAADGAAHDSAPGPGGTTGTASGSKDGVNR